MSANLVKSIADPEQFSGFLLSDPAALHVVMCFAEWDAPSQPGGQMDLVLGKLAEVHSTSCHFARVNAEDCGDLAEQLAIEAVPTFLFYKVRCHWISLFLSPFGSSFPVAQ